MSDDHIPDRSNGQEPDISYQHKQMLDVLKRFFTEDEWPFSIAKDNLGLRTGYEGKHGQWTCHARLRVQVMQIVFYSICPMKATEEQRVVMAEFLTRANYGLILGNFELDMRDGEIRYKTSLDVEDIPLDQPWSTNLIKPIVYANVMTMDKYLHGILRVIAGGQDPEAIIADIEE